MLLFVIRELGAELLVSTDALDLNVRTPVLSPIIDKMSEQKHEYEKEQKEEKRSNEGDIGVEK